MGREELLLFLREDPVFVDVLVADAADRTIAWTQDSSAGDATAPNTNPYGTPAPPRVVQVHYRIVFREVCTPLRDAPSLSVVFTALADVCEGQLYSVHERYSAFTLVFRSISATSLRLGPRGRQRQQYPAPRWGHEVIRS